MKKRLATLGLALSFLFGGTATAVESSTFEATWISQLDCVWGGVWIDNDGGQPRLQSVSTVWWSRNADPCTVAWVSDAPRVAVKQDLIAWSWIHGRLGHLQPRPLGAELDWRAHEEWASFAWASDPCKHLGQGGHWVYGKVWAGHWHGQWNGLNVPLETPGEVWVQ